VAIKIHCTIRREEDKNEKLTVVNFRCVTVARLQLRRIILQLAGMVWGTRNSRWSRYGNEKEKSAFGKHSLRFVLNSNIARLFARFIFREQPATIIAHQSQNRLCITLRRRFTSEFRLNFGQARNTWRDISFASVTMLNSFITMQTSCLSWNAFWYRLESI